MSIAAARSPPTRVYLLFADQPAMRMPRGASENAAKMNKIMSVDDAMRTGEMLNIAESAFRGVMFSFCRSLTPSAMFCKYPVPRWVGRWARLNGQNGSDQIEIMMPYRSWRRL